jgi:hypothetical protein
LYDYRTATIFLISRLKAVEPMAFASISNARTRLLQFIRQRVPILGHWPRPPAFLFRSIAGYSDFLIFSQHFTRPDR